MKKAVFLLAVCAGFMACTSNESATAGTSFNETVETDSIMKVIDRETDYFYKGDYTNWAKQWAHEAYAMQAWNHEDGTYAAAVGWEEINKQGKNWIEKYYDNGNNIIHPFVKRDKPLVKFFNDSTAYLTWKQYNADQKKELYSVSQEIRLMNKTPDGWKIVNVAAFWNAVNKLPADSIPQ